MNHHAAAPTLLAPVPPMGWNSWNAFGKAINERLVHETADAMVASGMRDLGYSYLVIDDHWHGGRDGAGYLYADATRFPSGMKELADYVHSRKLKFGIYSCAGEKTCGGEPGSHRHEEKDAEIFARWEVDFLKYDYCHAPDDYRAAIRRYAKMGDALRATGRPILYSICEWGPRAPWLWARQAGGHMWRTTFDVGDLWDTPHNVRSCIGILAAIDGTANLEKHAGAGGWNDPDMLVVGLRNGGYVKGGGCSDAEYQTQMTMWAMLAAPLFATCDLRAMSEETQNVLLNQEVIAIDQDPLGQQGFRVARKGATEVWKKPLAGDRCAVALLNRGEQKTRIDVCWEDVQLDPKRSLFIRDVLVHEDTQPFREKFSRVIDPHAAALFVVEHCA